MTFQVRQQSFEGPLDLLLQLIEKDELDITTIALSEVTEEYLKRVEALQRDRIPEISDFLVIAARLLLIKSRSLLHEETEEEPADDLAAQLAEYKLYRELSRLLGERLEAPGVSLGKAPSDYAWTPRLVADGVSLNGLHQAFAQVVERLPTQTPLDERLLEEVVTIEECIAAVRNAVAKKPARFETLFAGLKNRVALIVTFLALLELVKQRLVMIRTTGRQLMVVAR